MTAEQVHGLVVLPALLCPMCIHVAGLVFPMRVVGCPMCCFVHDALRPSLPPAPERSHEVCAAAAFGPHAWSLWPGGLPKRLRQRRRRAQPADAGCPDRLSRDGARDRTQYRPHRCVLRSLKLQEDRPRAARLSRKGSRGRRRRRVRRGSLAARRCSRWRPTAPTAARRSLQSWLLTGPERRAACRRPASLFIKCIAVVALG